MKRILPLLLFVLVLSTKQVLGQQTFDDKKRTNVARSNKNISKLQTSILHKKAKKYDTVKANAQFKFSKPFSFSNMNNFLLKQIKKDDKGNPNYVLATVNSINAKTSVEKLSNDFLSEVADYIKIESSNEEIEIQGVNVDKYGKTHIKLQQTFKGVRFYGKEAGLHISKDKSEISFIGRLARTPKIENITPNISKNKVISTIKTILEVRTTKPQPQFFGLKIPEPVSELVIYEFEGSVKLVWHTTIYANMFDRWEYFSDAKSGEVVDKFYHTCTLAHNHFQNKNNKSFEVVLPPTTDVLTDLNGVQREINGFQDANDTYMFDVTKPMFNEGESQLPNTIVGGIVTLDFQNQPYDAEEPSFFYVAKGNNNYSDAGAVSAHYNADIAYEYFRTTFNRNSLNGNGGTIYSVVNIADSDGSGFDNAFWNGAYMGYGNGNVAFSPLAGSLDVGGHEMGHGVIGTTANLEYRNQSGAINESFADVFGAMIDRDDWLLGEDVVNPQIYTSGALRDMQNPNNGGNNLGDTGWQPKDMSEFYTGTQDNGGVHINSGIPNRAYYLFATEVGRGAAEQVYYKALVDYLTVSSQFIDLRIAVLQAAEDIYGANSAEVLAAAGAFDTVGIVDGEPTDTEEELPELTGDQYILSYDVNDNDSNTLYISDIEAQGFLPISQTRLFRKPSVSDDGSVALYVTEDNTVNGITLDQNNISEEELSGDPIWSQVALSKDATKFAAILNDQSNVIYVFDLIDGDFQTFTLFNPTSADGVSTGDVLYPDAMEWDYSGEYVMYDALNSLQNTSGQDIEYWDVGFIKVWDNAENNYGDGSILKLFSSLPEGISIGNPSFSKTSGNIVAFDLFDANTFEYEVLAGNIETGQLNTIFQNTKLGFPNYSSDDRKLIFDAFATDDTELIAEIDLAADKISPSGSASGLIGNAKWGIWYTEGERAEEQQSSEKAITDYRFNGLNPTVVGTINGTNISATLPQGNNVNNLVATFTLSSGAVATVNGIQQQSGITANDFTNAITYTITAEDGSTQNYDVIVTIDTTLPDDNDGDGILNDDDLCPNTPLGTTVGADGCPIFSLPFDNFAVLTTDASCIGNSNGSISITANESFSYTVNLTGGATNAVESFFDSVSFNDLSAGQYTACITVQGQPDYEVCYDLSVDEPEPLGVNSKTDVSDKKVTLSLSGGGPYMVTLNGKVTETDQDILVLNLHEGLNEITVSTNKSCQGLHSELIIVGDQSYVYPNPISGESVSLFLPDLEISTAKLSIYDASGRVIQNEVIKLNNGQGNIKVGNLSEGTYFLTIQTEGKTYTKTLIRR